MKSEAHYCYLLPGDAARVIHQSFSLAYIQALQDYTHSRTLARGEVVSMAVSACLWLKQGRVQGKRITNNIHHFTALVTSSYVEMYLDQIARYQVEPSIYARDRVAMASLTWQEACQRIQEQYAICYTQQ